MNEKTIQHEYVMQFLCRPEDEGGLGYRQTANNIVSNDLFVPSHLAEFIKRSKPAVWNRLMTKYHNDENTLLTDLKETIKKTYLMARNAALFFNKNRSIDFAGEDVPLYFASGSETTGDEDFNRNIFAAVEECSHTIKCNDDKVYTFRPDITFFLNGIYIGYMELKTVLMGQNAVDDGRGKVVKDYLCTIQELVRWAKTEERAKEYKASTMSIFEKAIHLTASDVNETYVLRNIASLYDFAYNRLAGATPQNINDIAPEFLKVFKLYPFTSLSLDETQRFEEIASALYAKRMIEKEILYYNFLEYKYERGKGGRAKVSHHARLISPRPKQKFGCDKIMNRIVEMLEHEEEPNYYMYKLRQELIALDIPSSKIEEIILRREQYCNNKYVYSLLMQYAAGFGKSNIIGWTALQLKDFRYKGAYAYDKIMLVVDRLQLRDQLDTTMHNMNIDKSMFIEAVDKRTFISALDSPKRIIVVNIQKFLDLQQAIDESGTKLKEMRVAFLIDEIHRSNSGENNREMVDLFERLQSSFTIADGSVSKRKNLLVGFTATPSEETLSRFGEFKSAQIVPLWVPFDSYTMKEAIADGYILDPTENIYPYTTPVKFDSDRPTTDADDTDPVKVKQSKELVYSFRPRMVKIAEFIVDRLVNLVYGKIRGEGKAMLAVSSIPNAIQYTHIIRELYAKKCSQKPYDKYANAPISIVYSDSQKYSSSASNNFGKNETQVIQEFKQAKNGLIIVVDKLQTGFDEPKLHTLFLDKEISDINAIQTISRVNRTCKFKEECHVIDCSWGNVNQKNIKEAFKKFCDITISDLNPEEQAKYIERDYKGLCSTELYKTWFAQFRANSNDTAFMLSMEYAFRVWINQCIERELAIKKYNDENGYKKGDPDYKIPENDAKDLKVLIGQYSTEIESIKNIFTVSDKYYDAIFLGFWRIYCRIFNDAIRKLVTDPVYIVEPVDIDESGFTLEDEEPEEKGKGTPKGSTKRVEPKAKTINDVINLIKRLNNEEEVSAQCVQEWLKEIGLFFKYLSEDDGLTVTLKDTNFSDEKKVYEFGKKLNAYCRVYLRKRTDISDVNRLIKLMKDNDAQLCARYILSLLDTKDEPDYDFDTTSVVVPTTGAITDDMIAKIELLFNPKYDEKKVKAKVKETFASQFEYLCTHGWRKFDEVVDYFFDLLKKESLEDLDGLNESIPDYLNKYFFAKNNSTALKNIFKNLLLDLEPFLRKICYLKAGTLFDQYAGFVDVVKEIYYLKSLYFTHQPELEQFKSFYNSIYQWRNDNAHKAPILPDNEVKGAINMVLCIYLYATMVSITDLEANGYELERFDSNVYSLVNNIAAENNN